MASRRRKKRTACPGLSDAVLFSFDCQEVILRRLSRLTRGDAAAVREAQRMVAEKMTAGALAAWNAALLWPVAGEAAAAAAVASTYRKAVSANKRRLRR